MVINLPEALEIGAGTGRVALRVAAPTPLAAGALPDDALPDDALPGGSLSGAPVPGGALPGGLLPGGPVPGGALPGCELFGGALPGGPLPGGALPGCELFGGALPGGPLPGSAPLDRGFDADRLAAEVAGLRPGRWGAQRSFGTGGLFDEDGTDWRILPLRSLGGDADRTDPGGAGLLAFEDTRWLSRCAYLREVLAAVPAPLRSVRLMSLGPGAAVDEHRDGKYGLPYGTLRLHVPVVTSPGAQVVIDGIARHWNRGRLWYGDFNRPHLVRNDGTSARIHLVIDTLVTPALLELFPGSFTAALPASEVLLARQPAALNPAELACFRCRFPMPAGFADWAEDEFTDPWGDGVPASIEPAGGRLTLSVSGRPEFGLVHVGGGEFRFEGWSDERTPHVAPAAPGTISARRVPGGPSLPAAAIGFCVRRGRSRRQTSRPLR